MNEDGEQREDRPCAEEGALWPDYSCREETQEQRQQPAETLPEHTLPVPLCAWQTHTRMHEWMQMLEKHEIWRFESRVSNILD